MLGHYSSTMTLQAVAIGMCQVVCHTLTAFGHVSSKTGRHLQIVRFNLASCVSLAVDIVSGQVVPNKARPI